MQKCRFVLKRLGQEGHERATIYTGCSVCVCVYVCVRACVRACVCVCVLCALTNCSSFIRATSCFTFCICPQLFLPH